MALVLFFCFLRLYIDKFEPHIPLTYLPILCKDLGFHAHTLDYQVLFQQALPPTGSHAHHSVRPTRPEIWYLYKMVN